MGDFYSNNQNNAPDTSGGGQGKETKKKTPFYKFIFVTVLVLFSWWMIDFGLAIILFASEAAFFDEFIFGIAILSIFMAVDLFIALMLTIYIKPKSDANPASRKGNLIGIIVMMSMAALQAIIIFSLYMILLIDGGGFNLSGGYSIIMSPQLGLAAIIATVGLCVAVCVKAGGYIAHINRASPQVQYNPYAGYGQQGYYQNPYGQNHNQNPYHGTPTQNPYQQSYSQASQQNSLKENNNNPPQ